MIGRVICCVTFVLSEPAVAQAPSLFNPQPSPPEMNPRDDPARRKLAVPSIRATTDCVAREALNEPGMPEAHGRGELAANLANPIRRCAGAARFMIGEQDRIYGQGSGQAFYNGPYVEDLPRAVIARIGRQLEQRLTDTERREAERQVELQRTRELRRAELDRQDAERRVEAERVVTERRAEAEKRAAEQKLVMEKLESERRAERLKAEELKRQQKVAAEGANDILRNRMFDCVNREMRDLVRSGEGAEVLATATMTICKAEIDRLLEGFIEVGRIEGDSAYVSESEKLAIRNVGRGAVREQIVAVAVKAKAAASKSSNSTF